MTIAKERLIPFLQGMGSILEIAPSTSYSINDQNICVYVDAGGMEFHVDIPIDDHSAPCQTLAIQDPMEADWDALHEDWQAVGQDLRNAMNQVRAEYPDD